jgi:hypothetical protein
MRDCFSDGRTVELFPYTNSGACLVNARVERISHLKGTDHQRNILVNDGRGGNMRLVR